jgi:ABC-type nitrate/sulfonate/bicarbonate transport system substrate-binding protein
MKEKLNVTINLGGVGIDPIAMVVSKKADYAVVGADKALIAISNGAPIRIVSVDLQRNPVGWIARQDLKVITFDDIRGRTDVTLGDKSGTEVSAILQLVLKRRNLVIKPKAVSFDFSYFLTNKDIVYPVYLNEEPFRALLINKINIVEIDPSLASNGGIKLYGNVIITHKERIDKCPDQVRKLVDGIKFGWQFAKKNREETLSLVSKYVKLDRAYLQKSIERTIEYATNMYGMPVPPGHMEYTAWENTVKVLREAGLLTKDVDLKQAIYLK